nr:GNAT family N-acetyltransferase [Amphibacillus marinus]
MIRKLLEADDQAVKALIMQQPAENLFIIGDLEAFGYEQDFQEIWGDFDHNSQLKAVLLRYEENFIPFSLTKDFNAAGFAEIINHFDGKYILSGLKPLTAMIAPLLADKRKKPRELYYAKCTTVDQLPTLDLTNVKELQLADLDKWIQFINGVPEFSHSTVNRETKQRDMERGVGRSYMIKSDDGMVISSASTAAENSQSAMIVAVATASAYMGKGLATQCLSRLIADLHHEGKELCLFYDNPAAGKIYKKLGFKDIGLWTLYY